MAIHRWLQKTINTQSIIDVLLTSNPEFHTKAGTVKYALSDHYLIQTVITIPCNKACQISQNHCEVTYRDLTSSTNIPLLNIYIKATNEQFVNQNTGITWEMWKKYPRYCKDNVCKGSSTRQGYQI